MKLSLDITTDYSGKELYSYLSDSKVPDYVKQASLEEDYNSIPREAFADQGRKAFPLHTKEAVYLSNVYFSNKKDAIQKTLGKPYVDKIASAIDQAADLFEITADLADFTKQAMTKKASDYQERFMYVANVDGKDFPMLPVKTAADLVKTAEIFVKETAKYPMSWRWDICENMLKAAQELGVDELPDLVCKYAGMFYPDVPAIEKELWRRSKKLKLAEDIDTYNILKKEAKDIEDFDEVRKYAEIVYFTELTEGLYDSYKTASLLPDPVDKFYTMPVEKVAGMLDVVNMAGYSYHLDDLSKIAKERYEEAFGIDIDPKDREKLAEVLPTMPRSDVQLFKELTNISPVTA